MPTYPYTKPHKLSLLHDQLIAAGIAPLRVEGAGNQIWVTVSNETTEASVGAVVAAHDAGALSAGEQDEDEFESAQADLRAQYAQAVTRLDVIVTDGPTYTAAQVRDAVVDLARIQRRVLKVARRL